MIGALIAAGVGAGMSFYQAAQQRKLIDEANASAEKYMTEARKQLDVNYYDQLSINKSPYEAEREALMATGATAIQAGREMGRDITGVVGRVQMAQQQGQQDITNRMIQEQQQLERLQAEEDSRLAKAKANLDLGEVAGAQRAAADAEAIRNSQIQSGVGAIAQAGLGYLSDQPLYKRNDSFQTPLPTMDMKSTPTSISPYQSPYSATPMIQTPTSIQSPALDYTLQRSSQGNFNLQNMQMMQTPFGVPSYQSPINYKPVQPMQFDPLGFLSAGGGIRTTY